MNYEEFSTFEIIEDKNNPFCNLYKIDDETYFYIEPVFHTQMLGFKERRTAEEYQKIVETIISVAKKNKKVVFTGNFDSPLTEAGGFIFLEITDITDSLKIYVEDKSRGSDYGD